MWSPNAIAIADAIADANATAIGVSCRARAATPTTTAIVGRRGVGHGRAMAVVVGVGIGIGGVVNSTRDQATTGGFVALAVHGGAGTVVSKQTEFATRVAHLAAHQAHDLLCCFVSSWSAK